MYSISFVAVQITVELTLLFKKVDGFSERITWDDYKAKELLLKLLRQRSITIP